MTDVVEKLREGDIYHWRYSDPDPDNGRWNRYHCCSRIAIVDKSGWLRDTFWHSGSDGRWFGPDDRGKIEITFVANMADLDRHPEWQAEYYDEADIVNLNHSNSTRDNFYIRKGAKRSPTKMLAVAHKKIEECESTIRQAGWTMEKLRTAIAQIEAGETSNVYL